jgi:aryl-alcohol dehydrogenase-like predicted oxidoreductase
MKTTPLGTTGLEVSALGLGAMPLSISGRPPEAQAVAVIHRALDLGVTLIDTADAYCRDESDKHHNERLIAKALAAYPGDTSEVVVATKGGLMRPDGAWTNDSRPDHLRRTIRESHQALGGEGPIPLWQHHAPDPKVPLEASLAVVREAVEEGLIRFVGVSNYSVEQIELARGLVEVVSVQNQHNPWHRQPERDGVLATCEREGLTFLPWSPLGGGGRVRKLGDFPELVTLAREKEVTPHQVVLAWLRAKSPCVLPIPGASRVESLESSVAALEVELTGAEVERLDRAFG